MSNETEKLEEIEEIEEFDAPNYCSYTDYTPGVAPEDLPNTGEGSSGVERRVWDALYEVEDPEMPVSVVDLGLIYGVRVEESTAIVTMTLTYTGCPAREMLKGDIRSAAESADGVDSAEIELVWNPPWNVELVTETGRKKLREFGVAI
ncbi:1,2-phenylacetyl-CoA epoxidase subunit PaaD [Natronomonas sp. EA1]|uniref:1,2-phenylacetyl-CoA epoxidase subunit PaaD n=1 Tax=Natronomonas sp. EA1 TaxID=3421655 RepID=UPI003EBCE932